MNTETGFTSTYNGTGPVLSAYEDEQDKLDGTLVDEIICWSRIKGVLDELGFDIELELVNGRPDINLVKRN